MRSMTVKGAAFVRSIGTEHIARCIRSRVTISAKDVLVQPRMSATNAACMRSVTRREPACATQAGQDQTARPTQVHATSAVNLAVPDPQTRSVMNV